MSKRTLGIDDYGVDDLLKTAHAARDQSWKLRKHPTRDGHTIYSEHGYVIHPNLGYVNDEEDAAFMAMFDPAMVVSILERLRLALSVLASESHLSEEADR